MHNIDVFLYFVAILMFAVGAVVSAIFKNWIAGLMCVGLFCIALVPLLALTH